MPQKKPTQFHGPIAREFGFSEMPRKSAAESGFGRGYTIGFYTSFALVLGSFAALFFAGTEPARVRAAGCVLMSFGAAFTFAVVYTVTTNKEIPWSASAFGRVQSGVLDRRKNAVGFWASCVITLLVCVLFIGGGTWMIIHAPELAAHLKQQSRG